MWTASGVHIMYMKTLGDYPPCVCGCNRLAHICACKHNCCNRCSCCEYLADDGTDGVDDYESTGGPPQLKAATTRVQEQLGGTA